MNDLAVIPLPGRLVGGKLLVLTHDLGDPHNRAYRQLVERVFGGQAGVALVAGEHAYRVSGNPKQLAAAAEDALRALIPQPPAWLTAALYGAARVAEHSTAANAHFVARHLAELAAKLPATPAPPPSEAEIAEAGERNARRVLAGEPLGLPVEPISLVKTLFATSRLIWERDFVRRSLTLPLDRARFSDIVVAMTESGALWLWPMVGPIRVGGARMDAQRAFSAEAAIRLWPIWWGLIDAAEDEARACLTPFAPRPPSDALIEEPPGYQPPSTPDQALCAALARQLAAEAEQNAAYAPQGVFEAELPPALPLVAWGVHRLRLVALRPGRIWAAILGANGETLAAFPWLPDGTRLEGGMMIPDWAWGALDLALSALWHDLCVAGPEAVPGTRVGASPPRGDPSPRPSSPRPAYLPRPRAALHGLGKPAPWGKPEERAVIRRAAAAIHAVRGHYRRHEYAAERRDDKARAKQLREAAAARAAQFGLPPPPPGYTFVSPHIRGGEPEGERTPIRQVRARGLAALSGVLATGKSA